MTQEEVDRALEVYRVAYSEARGRMHPLSVGPDGGHAQAHRAGVAAVLQAGRDLPAVGSD